MRRILLCSVGLSPQVVTETLHALAFERRWIPDQLILLTTRKGAEGCRALLLTPQTGALYGFAREWRAPWIEGLAAGTRLETVETDAGDLDVDLAAQTFMDRVARILRDICADEDTELHVSLAGGRKPAAAVLALALALFGRERDRLSHVIVPDALVANPAYFYPPANPAPIAARDGGVLDPSELRVSLFDIPFPRLRPLVDNDDERFECLVSQASEALARPRLLVDCRAATLCWEQRKIPLPPALAAWLAWLAVVQSAGGRGLARVGSRKRDYATFYRHFAPQGRARQVLENLPDPLDAEWMEEKASRIAKLAADCGIRPRGARLVQRLGPRARARYALALDRHEIEVVSLPSPWMQEKDS